MRYGFCLIGLVLFATAALAQEGQTRAHPYDYIGFRNDGSGVYPNAKPPVKWDDRDGTNIIWKARMPNWTASSPIVVGRRVFTVAEPNLLLCCDADTGEQLWQVEADQTKLFDAETRAKARALYDEWHGRVQDLQQAWAELQWLNAHLNCLDGKPGDPFPHNLLIKRDAELKAKVRAQLQELPQERIDAMRARQKELEAQSDRWGKSPLDASHVFGRSKRNEWLQARRDLARYGYQWETHYGWIGHTFATPVSDGARVYASFGWGQVLCCDAATGRQVWMKFFQPTNGTDLLYTNSPIVLNGRLIVHGGGFIRALNAADGEVLWEHEYRKRRENHAGSPICVRVDGVDLVVTSHGRIYRLADGAIVAEGLPEAVATPAAHGDKLFLCNGLVHGTGGKLRAFGYTMRWDTPDKLQVKQDWVAKVGGHAGLWTGPVYHEGLLYFGYVRNIFVLDAATGKEVVNHVPNDFGYASSHAVNPAVAGDYFFTGDALGRILVVETGREGKPEALNFLTSDLHRDDLLQSVDYMKKQWWSKDWYPGANYLANTPFFKGERVYIRTHEHLFCIGK